MFRYLGLGVAKLAFLPLPPQGVGIIGIKDGIQEAEFPLFIYLDFGGLELGRKVFIDSEELEQVRGIFTFIHLYLRDLMLRRLVLVSFYL